MPPLTCLPSHASSSGGSGGSSTFGCLARTNLRDQQGLGGGGRRLFPISSSSEPGRVDDLIRSNARAAEQRWGTPSTMTRRPRTTCFQDNPKVGVVSEVLHEDLASSGSVSNIFVVLRPQQVCGSETRGTSLRSVLNGVRPLQIPQYHRPQRKRMPQHRGRRPQTPPGIKGRPSLQPVRRKIVCGGGDLSPRGQEASMRPLHSMVGCERRLIQRGNCQ